MHKKEIYNYPSNLSMNSPSNTPIATAPEIPSSSNMPYYELRSANYYPSQNYIQNENTAAIVTTAELSSKSLPPLSQLLPNNKTSPSEVQTDYYTQSMNQVRSGYPPYSDPSVLTGPLTTHDIIDNNQMYLAQQQQQEKDQRTLSHYVTSVPSNDLSMFTPIVNPYSRDQHYHLPSPPTSVIDNVLLTDPHLLSANGNDNSQKVFSFVSLQGVNHKKRQRRKYHEVERLYQCNYQNCNKAYGTLNHLNAHISMQQHGPKRQPSEFKELRKLWRKQKKELKLRKDSISTNQSSTDHSPMMQDSSMLSDPDAARQNIMVNHPNYPLPPHYMSMAPYINTQHWMNPQRPYSYQQPTFIPSAY